jgi:hypothetical protein
MTQYIVKLFDWDRGFSQDLKNSGINLIIDKYFCLNGAQCNNKLKLLDITKIICYIYSQIKYQVTLKPKFKPIFEEFDQFVLRIFKNDAKIYNIMKSASLHYCVFCDNIEEIKQDKINQNLKQRNPSLNLPKLNKNVNFLVDPRNPRNFPNGYDICDYQKTFNYIVDNDLILSIPEILKDGYFNFFDKNISDIPILEASERDQLYYFPSLEIYFKNYISNLKQKYIDFKKNIDKINADNPYFNKIGFIEYDIFEQQKFRDEFEKIKKKVKDKDKDIKNFIKLINQLVQKWTKILESKRNLSVGFLDSDINEKRIFLEEYNDLKKKFKNNQVLFSQEVNDLINKWNIVLQNKRRIELNIFKARNNEDMEVDRQILSPNYDIMEVEERPAMSITPQMPKTGKEEISEPETISDKEDESEENLNIAYDEEYYNITMIYDNLKKIVPFIQKIEILQLLNKIDFFFTELLRNLKNYYDNKFYRYHGISRIIKRIDLLKKTLDISKSISSSEQIVKIFYVLLDINEDYINP